MKWWCRNSNSNLNLIFFCFLIILIYFSATNLGSSFLSVHNIICEFENFGSSLFFFQFLSQLNACLLSFNKFALGLVWLRNLIYDTRYLWWFLLALNHQACPARENLYWGSGFLRWPWEGLRIEYFIFGLSVSFHMFPFNRNRSQPRASRSWNFSGEWCVNAW